MLARPYHAPDTVAGQITKERAVRKLRTLKVILMSVLLLACCSWLMVSAALAEDSGGGSHNFDAYGIIYGPTSTGTDDFGASGYKVGCYAPDRYYAAYLLCSGNNANFDVVLTDDQKAYLSNESTGGGFYELAQKFEADTMPIYVLQYGEGNTWFAEYNNHDLDAAMESLRNVINGDISGGSGSGGSNDGWLEFDWYPHYSDLGNRNYYILDTQGNKWGFSSTVNYTKLPSPVHIRMHASIFPDERVPNVANFQIEQNNNIWITLGIFEAPLDVRWRNNEYVNKSTRFIDNIYGADYSSGNITEYYSPNISGYTFDGTTITFTRTSAFNWNKRTYHASQNVEVNANITIPVPPTNWPDTPVITTPTEPDVPIHTGHGIDDLPEPSDYIEQPTYVTNVFTADLQGVIDALDEHCQHLQNAMYSNFQGFYDDITDFIWQVVQWLGSNINDMLNDLCDYLHDLFEWLAEQFDFSVSGSGYNDNTVVSWLRKIYARLGGGTNTRPTDPVADPFDFGEWLAQLFGNFVAWLFGLGSEAVSGLVEDFETLITKFPFSIPWDLGAMLALLVTAPVTPVFEFPCYTFAGGTISQVGTYRIDMSAWDDVMNTVRPMEVMVFAFWLAFKIDFFKGIVELNRN